MLAYQDLSVVADALHGAAMHLSDAAASASDVVDISAISSSVKGTGMSKPVDMTDLMSNVEWPTGFDPWGYWMATLKATIFKLHDVTGNFGWSILGIVLMVKAITYPLNYKVYASQFEMQAIQPEIDRIKEEYADNPEIINMKTSVLFQEKEVNPLAGCLPILIQFPVFVGLYRTLLNLGRDKVLDEPFLFLPSLEAPVVAGLSTDYVGVREDAPWLFQNWVDSAGNPAGSMFFDATGAFHPFSGQPPLGWHDTAIYCVLPALVVLVQLVAAEVTKKKDDPNKKIEGDDGSMQTIITLLPYLIGWFSMNLPAGCALYWVINTTLTTAQQVYIKSLFKTEESLVPASASSTSTEASVKIVTEAEKKMASQAQEDPLARGLKAAYNTFDSFLGMGLPEPVSEEEAKAAKLAKEDTEVSLSPLDKEFWIKDDSQAGKLKSSEKEDIKAKFLAAKAKRLAAKKKAGDAEAEGGAEKTKMVAPKEGSDGLPAAATPAAVNVGGGGSSDDGLDV